MSKASDITGKYAHVPPGDLGTRSRDNATLCDGCGLCNATALVLRLGLERGEARAEVERLRMQTARECECGRVAPGNDAGERLIRERDEARAEVERLREALGHRLAEKLAGEIGDE